MQLKQPKPPKQPKQPKHHARSTVEVEPYKEKAIDRAAAKASNKKPGSERAWRAPKVNDMVHIWFAYAESGGKAGSWYEATVTAVNHGTEAATVSEKGEAKPFRWLLDGWRASLPQRRLA
jgi:hypothetical protein